MDFSRVPPETLTESELRGVIDSGRFPVYLDAFGGRDPFLSPTSFDVVSPDDLATFHRMRSRLGSGSTDDVVRRVKGALLPYLEPTLRLYDEELLATTAMGSMGMGIERGLLDLFTLYLQTRSEAEVATALDVYFGVSSAQKGTRAHEVCASFFGFVDRAARMGQTATEGPLTTLPGLLDALPSASGPTGIAGPSTRSSPPGPP